MLSSGGVVMVVGGGPFPLPLRLRQAAECRGGVRHLARQQRQRAKTESLVEGAVASLNALARCQPGRVLRAEEPRRLFDADITAVQDAMLCNVARAAKQFVPAPAAAEGFPGGALAELVQCKSIYDLDENTAHAD